MEKNSQEIKNKKEVNLTLPSGDSIRLPERVGKIIRLVLKLQQKIDNDPLVQLDDNTTRSIKFANCHKTALFLTGDLDIEQLKTGKLDNPRTSGHGQIKNEILEGKGDTFMFIDDLVEYIGDKSFRVTILLNKDNHRLIPTHTFLILGKSNQGKTICFEKVGPQLTQGFKLRELDHVVQSYELNTRDTYMYHATPVDLR